MTPDLNDVRAFVAVADAGTFRGGARTIGTNVSGVSRRVGRLEDDLGARLFQRTTRHVTLTEAGQLYYDRAARALLELGSAQSAIRAMYDTPSGHLRITGPIDLVSLRAMAYRFLAQHPDVTMAIDLTNRYVDLVGEGYDLALRAAWPGDASLIARPVARIPVHIVASPDYLARAGVPEHPADLKLHHGIILGASRERPTWPLTENGELARFTIRPRVFVQGIQAVEEAALAGLGIALLSENLAAPHLASGRLQTLLCDFRPKPSAIYLVYPSQRYVLPAARAFIDFILANVDELLQLL